MIKEFVLAWEKNKDKLERYFRTNKQELYAEYNDLVKLLFDIVINPEIEAESIWTYNKKFDTSRILEIDDGEYQGTLIFVLHRNKYCPSVEDYVYTSVDYGSCSHCDILLRINDYCTETLPCEEQIRDYMQLSLHLLQRCKYMEQEDDICE